MGDVQFPPGYTLLLADPVVGQLNDLATAEQTAFLTDMARLGQAVLTATKAARINYEIQGNSEAALHAHVFARYDWEPDEYRRGPVWRYPSGTRDVPYNATDHRTLRRAIASALGG
jgi:diadenosine tetraphosphate (Ap4A) HIT family hydrolase